MNKLSDKDVAQYFRRSYTAVDGLWFMKMEERHGFEEALAVDCAVWKVLPKIQARTLKTITGMESGIEALIHCFTAKLDMEGFRYSLTRGNGLSFTVTITGCPWREALVRSDRLNVAGQIGNHICRNEYAVWAGEFDCPVEFSMRSLMCDGSECCSLEFRERKENTGTES